MRRLVLAPLLLLATAPAAEAATVSVGTRQDFPQAPVLGVVHYDAGPGEVNDLTWSFPAAGTVRFHDAAAAIAVTAGCTAVDAHTADCAAGRAQWSVEVTLGDGADRAAPASPEGTGTAYGLRVAAGDGDDVLTGGAGPVTLDGEAGNDTLTTGPAYATADGGPGDDVLTGAGSLIGGAGDDRITGTGTSFHNILGGPGDDDITGSPASDGIDGGGGRDTIRGGAGNDSIADGDGPAVPAPLITATAGDQPVDADVLDGGPGSDALEYGRRTHPVTVDLRRTTAGQAGEGDRVTGFENATTGSGDDRITGTSGPNRLFGGTGRDVIRALGGDDVVAGGSGATIDLGAGDDSVTGPKYGPSAGRPGRVACGTGTDLASYPDPRTIAPRGCETLLLRLYARIHRPATLAPSVQCGPFRRRPVNTPCTFRLRLQAPRGDATHGYRTGGTPLGATAWKAVPVGHRATFALPRRARGTRPVRVILERRTASRSRYTVGSYVTILR